MSDVTLKAIEDLMDQVLDKKLEENLKPIKNTLDSHTASLELLLSKKTDKEDSETVANHRLDRLEKWGKQVGEKVDLKLELQNLAIPNKEARNIQKSAKGRFFVIIN